MRVPDLHFLIITCCILTLMLTDSLQPECRVLFYFRWRYKDGVVSRVHTDTISHCRSLYRHQLNSIVKKNKACVLTCSNTTIQSPSQCMGPERELDRVMGIVHIVA